MDHSNATEPKHRDSSCIRIHGPRDMADLDDDFLSRHLDTRPSDEDRDEWQRRLAWMMEVSET